MERKGKFLLLLAVLCTLLLASASPGVSSAAIWSSERLESAATSAGGRTLESPPILASSLDPAGSPPDDNWDGTAAHLVPPQETEPIPWSPDSNVDPDFSIPEAPPAPEPAAAPPDDNWDGTAPSVVSPRETEPVPLPADRNIDPDVSIPEVPPAALPGRGDIGAVTAAETVLFPATGDVVNVQVDPYWYNTGDYAQGTRTPGLARVAAVKYDLTITNNVLNGTGHVDLDLFINGVVVGSFTVLPGETSKSVTFFFPPINGPNYTIRLQETNTVDPGLGSIVIPLNTSPITLYDSTTSPFPATGDVVNVQYDPYWWNAGDYAQGIRSPGLDSVTGVTYDLMITNNVLNGTGHVNLQLIINGVVVGSFTVLPGETSKSVTFFFPPINGPNYTIRLQETNTVGSGLGSIIIPLDTSPITFYSSTASPFFPATGDVIDVQNNPYWWHAGDYAQGTRTPGFGSVAGVKYDLTITNNVLAGTGHVDLDLFINGVMVGSFTVLPGETSKSVTFFFPPINGPNYTIRLEETNTVDPGQGSIVIPLDTSPITFYSALTSPFFPATGDVIDVQYDPYWWNAGDYAEGVRIPGFASVTGVTYDMTITNNVLNGTGHVNLQLSINGMVVGSFTVLPGETSKSVSFSFPPISGPIYIIRLEETNTVDPGRGSIVIPLDTSPILFGPRVFLPLVAR
jgi:hypothetical protein